MVKGDRHVPDGRIVLEWRPLRIYQHRLTALRPREVREYYDRLSKVTAALWSRAGDEAWELLERMGKRKYDVFVDIGCGRRSAALESRHRPVFGWDSIFLLECWRRQDMSRGGSKVLFGETPGIYRFGIELQIV